MHDPTGREGAASYYPGTSVPISAPAGPQPLRWGNLPHELRERKQWLLAGPNKQPFCTTAYDEVYPGSVTNRGTWRSFSRAAQVAAQRGLGIGYVLSADDPFTCIDLDVKDDTTNEQLERFERILYGFDSYTERSQSGRGFHIWCRGKVGKGRRRDGVEVYSQERFIICTGDVWRGGSLTDQQHLLDAMATQMQALGTPPAALVEVPPIESDFDHWDRKADPTRHKNALKFRALWFGGWQALGYPSQSEADMALVRMLCFNNPSNEQVRRMFRLSALGQRKKALRVDYVDGMIAEARAADAERAQVHAQAAAAMAPAFDAALEQYRARHRWPT